MIDRDPCRPRSRRRSSEADGWRSSPAASAGASTAGRCSAAWTCSIARATSSWPCSAAAARARARCCASWAGSTPPTRARCWCPQRRAVVFQEPRLHPLAAGAAQRRARAAARRRAAAPRSSAAGPRRAGEVGLADHARAWPVTLSGGEAQRVALARALVREPQLLLLDEPFGALDALTRIRMHVLLQELCARHRPAVLLVTHDVDEAILLADRVLVLVDGRITLDAAGRPDRPRDRGHPASSRCAPGCSASWA